jgi:hypothetical protein
MKDQLSKHKSAAGYFSSPGYPGVERFFTKFREKSKLTGHHINQGPVSEALLFSGRSRTRWRR